jgi:hypothetical protein
MLKESLFSRVWYEASDETTKGEMIERIEKLIDGLTSMEVILILKDLIKGYSSNPIELVEYYRSIRYDEGSS